MRLKTSVQYTTITAVSVILALIGAEAYLSARAASPLTIPFYNRLYPYVMFRPYESATFVSTEPQDMSHRKSKVFFYTNSDGFRVPSADYDLPRKKPAGQLRIAVLGASAVQLGSTFDAALPGSLRTVLRAKHPGADIEVINAGIQSCVSRQSIAQLVFTVAEYEPDVVILYDGANDIGLPMTYESRPNFPYNFQAMEAAWDTYRQGRQEPLFRLLLSRSRLYNSIRARFQREGSPKPKSPYIGTNALAAERVLQDKAFVREHIAGYLSNWRKLAELSAAYKYRPVCVLQPTGILDREYSLPLLMKFYNLDRETASRWIEAFATLYGEAERQIQDLRSRYPDAVFLDLRDALKPAKNYFWDPVHVYDEVNLVLAERMYPDLRTVIERDLRALSRGMDRPGVLPHDLD